MSTSTPDPRLFAHTNGGLSIAVQGPAGTGKSTFAGSCGKYGRVKLLATKPRESNSWLYREHGIFKDAELFFDARWRPASGSFDADGYLRLVNRIWELYDDTEFDFVVLDPFTDVVNLAAHEILKTEKVPTPREMRDPMGFYGSLKYRLKEITQALTALQFAARPKHIVVTVHTQPAKEDTERKGQVIKSADQLGKGVEYEGTVLPMIEGAYRREFASEFDAVFFSDVVHEKKLTGGKLVQSTNYVLQCSPDAERHAKQTLGPLFAAKTIPNDFGALLDVLAGGKK